MTLSWAGGRRLASVSKEGLSASYVYNAGGIRTQKTVNGVTTNYYLDGNSILRQVTGNDVLEFFYDANGVLGFYYNNTPYYYLKNLQGDIVGILDANGTQVVSYTYDAWGAPLSVTGTAADTIGQINPFRYRGYYYDTETGFYYVSNRYYDPQTYRFINSDTTNILTAAPTALTDKNLFAYCDNNPIMRSDNGGDFWHIVVGAAVGAVVSGAITMVSNHIAGKPLTSGLGTSMLFGALGGALSASGLPVGYIIAGSGVLSAAETAINIGKENGWKYTKQDVAEIAFDGAVGAAFGAIGGKGNSTKHLMNLGKQSVKRPYNAVVHKGLKAAAKEGFSAAKYYCKNTVSYYNHYFKYDVVQDYVISNVNAFVTSDYMKSQYQRYVLG